MVKSKQQEGSTKNTHKKKASPNYHLLELEVMHKLPSLPEIMPWEVKHTIKQMKQGKVPGMDNITVNLLRDAGESTCANLVKENGTQSSSFYYMRKATREK